MLLGRFSDHFGALDTEIIHESPNNDTLSPYAFEFLFFLATLPPFAALEFPTTIHESMESFGSHLLIHKYAVCHNCFDV